MAKQPLCPHCQGILPRYSGGRKATLDRDKILALHRDGVSSGKIAELIGASRWGVRKIILEAFPESRGHAAKVGKVSDDRSN